MDSRRSCRSRVFSLPASWGGPGETRAPRPALAGRGLRAQAAPPPGGEDAAQRPRPPPAEVATRRRGGVAGAGPSPTSPPHPRAGRARRTQYRRGRPLCGPGPGGRGGAGGGGAPRGAAGGAARAGIPRGAPRGCGGAEARAPRGRGADGRLGRPRAATFGERHGGVVRVDGVQYALVANLRLGDEADLAAQVRGARRAAHGDGRPPGPLTAAQSPRRPLRLRRLRLGAASPPTEGLARGPASERRRAAGVSEENAGEEGPPQPHPGPRAATPRPRTLASHWLAAPAAL